MKNLKYLVPAALILVAIATWYALSGNPKGDQVEDVYTKPTRGPFEVSVMATGEIKAKNSKKITAPSSTMQSVGIYQTTISNIIPEGSIVKPGQFVAQLDQTEIATKISEVQTEIDKINTQMEQALIDTTIEMRNLSDEIKNLEFSIEEKELLKELNKYEPQSIIRQNEIDLEKAKRDFDQKTNNLRLTKEKNNAKVREITASLRQQQIRMKRLTDLQKQFRIMAPTEGMVTYRRSWNGERQGVGSQIRPWDPVVAELPDLSDMICQAYINEVDINKVSVGLDVTLKVDALPDRQYPGHIIKVANIGENMRNYDSKVFEVIIQVEGLDSLLRPSMTAGAEILTEQYERKIYVPLESVHKDSLTFVLIKTGKSALKQEVITGAANENDVIIEYGLKGDETLLLNVPEDMDQLEQSTILEEKKKEVISNMAKEKQKLAELKEEKRKSVNPEEINTEESGGGGRIVIFN